MGHPPVLDRRPTAPVMRVREEQGQRGRPEGAYRIRCTASCSGVPVFGGSGIGVVMSAPAAAVTLYARGCRLKPIGALSLPRASGRARRTAHLRTTCRSDAARTRAYLRRRSATHRRRYRRPVVRGRQGASLQTRTSIRTTEAFRGARPRPPAAGQRPAGPCARAPEEQP